MSVWLALLSLSFGLQSHATCRRELTVDQRYALVRETYPEGREYRQQLSRLMNEAYTPVLSNFANDFRSRSKAAVRRGVLGQLGHQTNWGGPDVDVAQGPKEGLDGRYKGVIRPSQENLVDYRSIEAPYTSHNVEVMSALWRAVSYMQRRINLDAEDYQSAPDFLDAKLFLKRHSFTQTDLRETMAIANNTILQAAAQLTASPLAGFTPEQILAKVFTRDCGPSLLNRFALALGPEYLGQYGLRSYVVDAVSVASNRTALNLSLKLREIVGLQRERRRGTYGRYEFGFGCPVAHAPSASMASALDHYLDAVFYVYTQGLAAPASIVAD